jgi:hypothetical protein
MTNESSSGKSTSSIGRVYLSGRMSRADMTTGGGGTEEEGSAEFATLLLCQPSPRSELRWLSGWRLLWTLAVALTVWTLAGIGVWKVIEWLS